MLQSAAAVINSADLRHTLVLIIMGPKFSYPQQGRSSTWIKQTIAQVVDFSLCICCWAVRRQSVLVSTSEPEICFATWEQSRHHKEIPCNELCSTSRKLWVIADGGTTTTLTCWILNMISIVTKPRIVILSGPRQTTLVEMRRPLHAASQQLQQL